MTTSRTFDKTSAPKTIEFQDPDAPVVTALGDQYVVTFHQDTGVSIGSAIYGAILDQNGNVLRAPQSMTAGAFHARGNATYSYGDRFVMVWADDRFGPYQLFARTFDKKLAPLSDMLRLTNTKSITLDPTVAASSDGGLGILYSDQGSGDFQTFFMRLDCKPGFQLK